MASDPWHVPALWGTHASVVDVNASGFTVRVERVQSEKCPAPNHPDDPDVWCGCKHPDFWYWGKAGWVPTEHFHVSSPEQRAKRSRAMKARWARLKELEAA